MSSHSGPSHSHDLVPPAETSKQYEKGTQEQYDILKTKMEEKFGPDWKNVDDVDKKDIDFYIRALTGNSTQDEIMFDGFNGIWDIGLKDFIVEDLVQLLNCEAAKVLGCQVHLRVNKKQVFFVALIGRQNMEQNMAM